MLFVCVSACLSVSVIWVVLPEKSRTTSNSEHAILTADKECDKDHRKSD